MTLDGDSPFFTVPTFPGTWSWDLRGLTDAEPLESSRELVSAVYPGLSATPGDTGGRAASFFSPDLLFTLFFPEHTEFWGEVSFDDAIDSVRSRDFRLILL